MICVEWRPEFLVGVEEVDSQHRQLFVMISRLREAIDQQAAADELQMMLDGLVVYLKEHFGCEESLLAGHPGWSEHHRQHWRFTEKVLHFLREFKRSKGQGGNDLAMEICDFLCGWLQEHSVAMDRCFFTDNDASA